MNNLSFYNMNAPVRNYTNIVELVCVEIHQHYPEEDPVFWVNSLTSLAYLKDFQIVIRCKGSFLLAAPKASI